MLTDIFARRYQETIIWTTFTEDSRRLITQGYQLLEELFPYYSGGEESSIGKRIWTELHATLARELGLDELSPRTWGYWTPTKHWMSGTYSINMVCKTWMLANFAGATSADQHIKERLSLVEIGFRAREQEISAANAALANKLVEAERFMRTRSQRTGRLFIPGSGSNAIEAENNKLNLVWRAAVNELNTRFRHADAKLNYHNGFIQIQSDAAVADQIENPFWKILGDAKWKNVDLDFKEALDLRDTGGRDPALYAAKALESTIKIISDEKSLSNGKERGASNFIDNLRRGNLIEDWETEALKLYFSKIRNPLGHGPGMGPMPTLGKQQTEWAIESCMSWIKNLVLRT